MYYGYYEFGILRLKAAVINAGYYVWDYVNDYDQRREIGLDNVFLFWHVFDLGFESDFVK